jgi:hypothetical protein
MRSRRYLGGSLMAPLPQRLVRAKRVRLGRLATGMPVDARIAAPGRAVRGDGHVPTLGLQMRLQLLSHERMGIPRQRTTILYCANSNGDRLALIHLQHVGSLGDLLEGGPKPTALHGCRYVRGDSCRRLLATSSSPRRANGFRRAPERHVSAPRGDRSRSDILGRVPRSTGGVRVEPRARTL